MTRAQLEARVTGLTPQQRARLAARLGGGLVARAAGDTRQLVAYVVPKPGRRIDTDGLREQLEQRLPSHMVPTSFVALESLPRTPNGKVDRRALPLPPAARRQPADSTPRNQTETALCEIWRTLLGTREIGIHDNFFQHGGHSMLALRLTSAIQKRFGVSFGVATVFEHPTIAELGARLHTPQAAARNEQIVTIRAEGSQPPLFCLHCVHGHVHYYHPLAERLGSDQPVYALQPPSRDGSEPIPDTIEKIATQRVEAVRSLQPRGPYRLCGFSFGGVLAFEIARQLRAAGERVELVALFDTFLPRREQLKESVARHSRRLLAEVGPAARCARVFRSLAGHFRTTCRQIGTALGRWGQVLRQRAYIWTHRPLPVEMQGPWVSQQLMRAMSRYDPTPYPGRVVLFRSPGRDEWAESRHPQKGWFGLAEEGLVVEESTDVHGEIVREPFVKHLAERLVFHWSDRTSAESADRLR